MPDIRGVPNMTSAHDAFLEFALSPIGFGLVRRVLVDAKTGSRFCKDLKKHLSRI